MCIHIHVHMHIIHTCLHAYICTHSCTCMHLCSDKYTFMNTNYIHRGPCTHTHMSTCTHLHTCFLNICLSYHPCSSFVFSFTRSLHPALLPCLRDALDGSRQFSLHHGSLFMCSSAILMADQISIFRLYLGGPPSLWPTLFMGTCPCPQAQAVKLYHHLFFHLSINVTRSVLTRPIESYKTSNTPYQPCYCKPWGMLGQ